MDNIQDLLNKICGTTYTTRWKDLNFKHIPITQINASVDSEIDFNRLYQELLKSSYTGLKRTKSGGISINKKYRLYDHFVYDVKCYGSVIEMVVCKPVNDQMRSYRIQYRNNNFKDNSGNEQLISGTVAFRMFERELHNDGIEISKYAVDAETGKKYNSEIHKPDVRFMNTLWKNRVFTQANHLDFHKFYISGLAFSHPEFAKTIKRLADKSKTEPIYKTVLASTIGYMHSPVCNYKYALLARDAINNAYTRYDAVLKVLGQKRQIIATNTDGIWYSGEEWHGIFETPELGGWSNDHVNCKIRFKSAGSYEYEENGEYHPVVRGRTRLDNVKPRDEWRWGDIFNIVADPLGYKFEEGVGIVWQKIM